MELSFYHNVLYKQYVESKQLLVAFSEALKREVGDLLLQHNVQLGTPIEARVKSWDSVVRKVRRQRVVLPLGEKMPRLSEIVRDLTGLRVILLFRRDLDRTRELLGKTFAVNECEDTSGRLTEVEFGYQSWHYLVRLAPGWAEVPSLTMFKPLEAELQVRTLAQHLWAAASHKLQYKSEDSIPPPLRRSIHRVAALLETVDKELENVLTESESYQSSFDLQRRAVALDASLVCELLDRFLSEEDSGYDDLYEELLRDLVRRGITTVGQLEDFLTFNLDAMEALDGAWGGSHFNNPGLVRAYLGQLDEGAQNPRPAADADGAAEA